MNFIIEMMNFIMIYEMKIYDKNLYCQKKYYYFISMKIVHKAKTEHHFCISLSKLNENSTFISQNYGAIAV